VSLFVLYNLVGVDNLVFEVLHVFVVEHFEHVVVQLDAVVHVCFVIVDFLLFLLNQGLFLLRQWNLVVFFPTLELKFAFLNFPADFFLTRNFESTFGDEIFQLFNAKFFLFQLFLQVFYDFFAFFDCELLVNDCLVFDLLGSLAEPQTAESLVFVVTCGGQRNHEGGLGVAAQTFLQNSGEFTVTLGDV